VVQWERPATASFLGTQLLLTPGASKFLNATKEVTYDTTQINDAVWSINYYCGFTETYIPTETGIPQSSVKGLHGYIGGAASVSGVGLYKGIVCTSYSAAITSSDPAAMPSGVKVLHIQNDIYLKAIDGTIVYKRTKISADVT
jgi:hypothetical protein